MKKVISLLCTALLAFGLLCGCSNDSGNTKEVTDIKKVSASQIWDGYEALQGQDYGVIKLPDRIEKGQSGELYSLTLTPRACDEVSASTQFFKAFFGSDYSETAVTHEDGTRKYLYSDEAGQAGFINGMPVYAVAAGEQMIDGNYETVKICDPEKDKAYRLDFFDGSCTVGELTETADRFMNDSLFPLYGSGEPEMKLYKLIYFKNKLDPNDRRVQVFYGYRYKGLEIQEEPSLLAETTIMGGYEVQRYYSFFHLLFDFKSKDKIVSFSSRTMPFDADAERLDELISLKDAAELLKKELAARSRYEFDNIELRYCHKSVGAATNDPKLIEEVTKAIEKEISPTDKKIVPTWCFEWTGMNSNGEQPNSIKVNAVTGEITIDAVDSVKAPKKDDSSQTEDTSSLSDDSGNDPYVPDPLKRPEPVSYITANAISYIDNVFTYEYNGEIKTVTMDHYYLFCDASSIPIRIVNNKYGIRPKAVIGLDKDGNVVNADVIKLNGEGVDDTFGTVITVKERQEWLKEHPYSDRNRAAAPSEAVMRRIKGSIYEISNRFGSIETDLNDMDYYLKGNYPDVVERVRFSAFRFNSGEIILLDLSVTSPDDVDEENETINPHTINTSSYPMFAGTIRSLSEERAVVLLTDGITTCDVPTYYNDCELKEGMKVMLTLDADISLYGSGEHYKADYAVFTTHIEDPPAGAPIFEGYKAEEHSKFAYALRKKDAMLDYRCVTAAELSANL